MNTDSGVSKKAFTLVELLVVALIFGVIIAAIASCLIAGVRTWDYARKYSGVEADAMIRLETVHRDIADTFRFYAIAFNGGAKDLMFPGLIDVTTDGGEEPGIGTIKYYFDPEKKMIFKKAWIFPESEPLDDKAERILTGVSDMEVSYYSLPSTKNGGGGGVWQEDWNSVSNIPGAVTMELSFESDNKRTIKIKRTVIIPAAVELIPAQTQQPKAAGR